MIHSRSGHTSETIRRPAVAGYFYPSDPTELAQEVDRLIDRRVAAQPARALLVPHGSVRHCGAVIGATLSRAAVPRSCVIVGPSHTGSWMPWSLMAHGWYRTPLGDVPINRSFADALQARCPFLEADAWAQHGEHAVEVVLPFLQRLGPPDLSIVPVVLGAEVEGELAQFADALAQVVRMAEEAVLLVASSDLPHYEPLDEAVVQDRRVLETIQRLDSEALMREVRASSIRMCGAGAVAGVMMAATRLGVQRAEVIRYGTSADAGGDPDSVIGYAGVVIIWFHRSHGSTAH